MKKAAIEQKAAENHEQRSDDLKKRAKNGDPLARMRLAKPNSLEYWKAYQQYERGGYNRSGRFVSLINDISILEEDFAEKVVNSIEQKGFVSGRTITGKN